MRTGTRLAAYGAGLAVLFGSAFVIAGAVVPDRTVQSWKQAADRREMDHGGSEGAHVRGVALEQDGYVMSPVSGPAGVGTAGQLSFRISGPEGHPLTEFETSHEKKLHLIVVRSDGTRFRHVHPAMSADGTWSIPWTWPAAGSYGVYADFVPATGQNVTLTRSVDIAGPFIRQAPTRTSTRASVDGFDVTLTGDLHVGAESPLTVEITRNGTPVTTVQPYLGAFGHLVALREGDLAYLHVHPDGDEPAAGDLSGPRIRFTTEAPTPGRYLLYLDFRVDGAVHTAPFVVDTSDETSGA
jgi:hypothetical protein